MIRLVKTPVIHALTCPVRSRWRRRRYAQPLWREDPIAVWLGVARFGCPRCGRGAIEERDSTAEPQSTDVGDPR